MVLETQHFVLFREDVLFLGKGIGREGEAGGATPCLSPWGIGRSRRTVYVHIQHGICMCLCTLSLRKVIRWKGNEGNAFLVHFYLLVFYSGPNFCSCCLPSVLSSIKTQILERDFNYRLTVMFDGYNAL